MGSLGKRDNVGTVGSLLGVRAADRYLKTLTALDQAARDPKLKGLLIKVETSDLGMGRAQELRQAIQHLKDAGKKVVALILSCNDPDYLVASAADTIYAVPQSMLAIDGLQSSVHFFGQAAQKVGVHFDVARVGRYKNSPDQLTRSEMSAEQREVINAYLDTDVKVLADAVLASRHLSKEQWQAALDEGLKSPQRSKQLGLIDDVLTPAEIEERLPKIIPGARLDTDYRPFDVSNERWGLERQIAIIPVSGNISGGKDSTDPLALNPSAGADTFIRALNDAVEDPLVAAIVLRIESPGGDGLASELMYRAVLQAKKKKPVVASMGDIAASGGYYTAMGADEIWAEPGTITGSIGVFYLKPSVSELAQKLGVHQVSINRGALAGQGDLFQPWTDAQRQAAQKWVDTFYDGFISEVAQSRKKPKEAIDAVAQGRVWSGEAAQERGLVDRLGGLREAVNSAKQRAGLSERSEARWVVYGARSTLISGLVDSKAVAELAAPTLPWVPETAVQGLAQELHLESWQFQPGAKTHMGWSLEVR
jgi:protease-4